VNEMKTVALAEVKDQLSKYLDKASHEQIVITKHGKPAGVLIGFESEDDWFEFKLLNDPCFLKRIEHARASIRAGRGISWDQIKKGTANFGVRRTRKPRRVSRR
jgi:prevent-host-death family protein